MRIAGRQAKVVQIRIILQIVNLVIVPRPHVHAVFVHHSARGSENRNLSMSYQRTASLLQLAKAQGVIIIVRSDNNSSYLGAFASTSLCAEK